MTGDPFSGGELPSVGEWFSNATFLPVFVICEKF